jgi:hypothetical protein
MMNEMLDYLNGLLYLFHDLVDEDEPTCQTIEALIEDIEQDENLDEGEKLEAALAYGWLIGALNTDDTELGDDYRTLLSRITGQE